MKLSAFVSTTTMKRHSLLIVTAVVLSLILGCHQLPQTAHPYLVLYAFQAEGELLGKQMATRKNAEYLGRSIQIGSLAGQEIVLAESGIGMTNAAMTTQKLIDLFDPKGVIFSGIAGAIDSSVHIGDIVVASSWSTHDYGYIGAKGFQPESILAYNSIRDSVLAMINFQVDSMLYQTALKLRDRLFSFEPIGTRMPRLLLGGVNVSGNAFIDNAEKRLWLQANFKALTTDMESAAVAQVCTANGVPFIIFRSASDLAGGSKSGSASEEISQFFKVAAENSSKVVIEFLKEL